MQGHRSEAMIRGIHYNLHIHAKQPHPSGPDYGVRAPAFVPAPGR
jgi:hypothetical protein